MKEKSKEKAMLEKRSENVGERKGSQIETRDKGCMKEDDDER